VIRIVTPSGKQTRILLSSVRELEGIILTLGAGRELPECRLVVLAGAASATKQGVDYTPVILTPPRAE